MLIKHFRSSTALVLAAALIAFLPASTAEAQSTRELRQENERLRAQVRDLEEQLSASREQIRQLQEQVEQLQQTIKRLQGGESTTQPPDEPEYSVDLSDPQFSPLGLFRTLQTSYRDTLNDMEVGEPDSQERAKYMRTLRHWMADMNRKFRQRITWHVRVMDAVGNNRRPMLRLQTIDPETEAAIGRPFDVTIPRRLTGTIRQIEQRQGLDHIVMDAVLTPDLRMNERRVEPGPFDNPRLIGAFAEFGFDVTPTTFISAEEAAERDAKKNNRPTGNSTGDTNPERDRNDNSDRD